MYQWSLDQTIPLVCDSNGKNLNTDSKMLNEKRDIFSLIHLCAVNVMWLRKLHQSRNPTLGMDCTV